MAQQNIGGIIIGESVPGISECESLGAPDKILQTDVEWQIESGLRGPVSFPNLRS
jgi:hypothetical protein